MNKIPSLELPKEMPTPAAIKSWEQNEHNYETEFWEFEYEIYRYLKNITDDELYQRYQDICRNFYVLVRPERHVIPINSFLSSWYWYKKEYHARYEFFLRGISLVAPLPKPRGDFCAPARSRSPNSGDVLFRYGNSQYLRSFLENGTIRIRPASAYKDGPVLDPRTDDELRIKRYVAGQHVSIVTKEGTKTPVIGDLCKTYLMPKDYYVLCMSTDFEPKVFEEFGYDCCLIIKDSDQFMLRLENSTGKLLSGCYFYHNPIQYFDPYDPPNKSEYIDPAMCKDFRFAYQMEYRVIWHPQNNLEARGDVNVRIGSLKDICELFILN